MRKRTLTWLSGLSVMALLSLALPGMAFGQQPPGGVTTVVEKRFEFANPPAEAGVVQLVLDFAPGAWTPPHTHGGPGFVTVLEGEMTLRQGGAEEKFRPGEGWIDPPDVVHEAGNDTTANSRLVVAFVLPKGATPTTVQGTGAQAVAPPGPTTVAQMRMDAPSLPAQYDVVQRLTEAAPGATIPMHTHPGPNFAIALDGELTLIMEGMTRTVSAGESWVEPPDVVHGGPNSGSGVFRVVGSTLLARGAPVSVAAQPAPAQPGAAQPAPTPAAKPAPAPAAKPVASPAPAPAQMPRALPRTGSAVDQLLPMAPAAVVGAGMLLGGLALRRRRRR